MKPFGLLNRGHPLVSLTITLGVVNMPYESFCLKRKLFSRLKNYEGPHTPGGLDYHLRPKHIVKRNAHNGSFSIYRRAQKYYTGNCHVRFSQH